MSDDVAITRAALVGALERMDPVGIGSLIAGICAEREKFRRERDEARAKLAWVDENPDKVVFMATDDWAYVVREYKDGWDTEYSETFKTFEEAIDAARESGGEGE